MLSLCKIVVKCGLILFNFYENEFTRFRLINPWSIERPLAPCSEKGSPGFNGEI